MQPVTHPKGSFATDNHLASMGSLVYFGMGLRLDPSRAADLSGIILITYILDGVLTVGGN